MRDLRIALSLVIMLACLADISYAGETSMTNEEPATTVPGGGASIHTIGPCQSRPNCVSSMDERPARNVTPFKLKVAHKMAWAELRAIVEEIPRVRVAEEDGYYIRFEIKSKFFGFTDDLEFLLIEEEGLIHIRSESRAGYWDFGVNKRRIKKIAQRLRAKETIAR